MISKNKALTELMMSQYWYWLMDTVRTVSSSDIDSCDKTEVYGECLLDLYAISYEVRFEEDTKFINKIMKKMRTDYCKDSDVVYSKTYFPNSFTVLEVLIAISRYANDVVYNSGKTRSDVNDYMHIYNEAWWFWEMFHNLGLTRLTDEAYEEFGEDTYEKVRHKCDNFMKRRYTSEGIGNIFLFERMGVDIAGMSLASQIDLYMEKNHVFLMKK